MMSEVWPFLVSRNLTRDYHTVVQPAFLTTTKDFLSYLDEEETTPIGEARLRKIAGYSHEPVWALYRVTLARRSFLGMKGPDDKPLLDGGREIRWTEGVLLRDEPDCWSYQTVDEEVFSLIRGALMKNKLLDDFWNNSDFEPHRFRSTHLELDLKPGDLVLRRLPDLQPKQSAASQPAQSNSSASRKLTDWFRILFGALILIFVVILWRWRYEQGFAAGQANAVFRVLQSRAVRMTPKERLYIQGNRNLHTVNLWLAHVHEIGSASELLRLEQEQAQSPLRDPANPND